MNVRNDLKSIPAAGLIKCRQPNMRDVKFICIALVLFSFCFLFGCAKDSNDYEKFIENQIRYANEKELISLIDKYNTDVISNKVDLELLGDQQIGFTLVFEDEVIIKLEDIISVTNNNDAMLVKLNASATQKFAQVASSNNIGKTMDFVFLQNEVSTICTLSILTSISNGEFVINSSVFVNNESFPKLISAKIVLNSLIELVNKYNKKTNTLQYKAEYLPSNLPTPPQILDVMAFLEKAKESGFDIT